MARLFGTDGIRGLANGDVLTPELAMRLAGTAGARLVAERRASGAEPYTRPVVVVGRDTRPSGQMLEAAAVAGFTSAGCDVELLGVVPTPVVAHATAWSHVVLGLMITASHNPEEDNGLKLFADGGLKLPDAVEDELEAAMAKPWDHGSRWLDVGRVHADTRAEFVEPYLASLLTSVGSLQGLKVVVDCANGSAWELAPELYQRAGATVIAIHANEAGPINRVCGATHPQSLAAAVVEHSADLGIAHDGDADRCIVVDASGTVLNGDQVLGLLALARKEAGLQASDTLVATVMSNLGLHQAMAAAGIRVATTGVGDRYVLEEMRAHGYRLGGEQSGHVILADYATTGDGLLTALQVMDRVVRSGRPVSELAGAVTLLPQVLLNVTASRDRAQAPEVLEAVAKEEAVLAGTGRVLLRPSGTEPLVRVMVEAPTQDQAQAVAERLAVVVQG